MLANTIMKKILLLIFLFSGIKTSACDVCGCGNGSSFFGILPQSHFKFGGIRYQTRSFESHFSMPKMKTEENFQIVEPWVRLYPLPKTQLVVMAPYQFGTQTTVSTNKTIKKMELEIFLPFYITILKTPFSIQPSGNLTMYG